MKPPLIRRPKQSPAQNGSGAQVPLRQGFLVADKYGLIEPLGTGSMGSVWKASHVMLGHMVAIKFLHASVEAYPEGRVRFEREAKLSARLGEASRHICRVSDFGVIGSGTPFVVMELLQGEELSACLRRERSLPLERVTEIVMQLCRALTVAHEAGVIHRDLKPANVFLCKPEDGQDLLVKLLDFGVAKAALEHEDTQATRAGTIFGTPGYMSPEQIMADAELDARSDLWSVAVMAYRMAVGRTPFGAGSMSELGLRILTANPAPPSRLRPELPTGFDEWIKKGLAKRREERFSSATELSNQLIEVTQARASEAVPEEAAAAEERITATDDSTYNPMYRSEEAPAPRPSRFRRVLIATATALALALLACAVLLVTTRGHKVEPVTERDSKELPGAPKPRPPEQFAVLRSGSQSPAPVTSAPKEPLAQAPAIAENSVPDAAPSPLEAAPAALGPRQAALGPAPAAANQAPRKRSSKSIKPAAAAGAVEKRASELWNKKDEL
jgi:serine/threonine protein kinase